MFKENTTISTLPHILLKHLSRINYFLGYCKKLYLVRILQCTSHFILLYLFNYFVTVVTLLYFCSQIENVHIAVDLYVELKCHVCID